MRLIDADKLHFDVLKINDEGDEIVFVYQSDIDTAPTVDAVPVKHGQWEEKTVGSYEENAVIAQWQSARCSECGRYLTTPYLYYFTNYDYCPNCGAKMNREKVSE